MGAFEQLYERHNRRVYSLCLRMTQNAGEAEDLAQEAFIQLFERSAVSVASRRLHLVAPADGEPVFDALPQEKCEARKDDRRRRDAGADRARH
jgi:hypothetical protein